MFSKTLQNYLYFAQTIKEFFATLKALQNTKSLEKYRKKK